LPLTSDLQTLASKLKLDINIAILELGDDSIKLEAFRNLETALLTSIILFNRRRAGEPAKMKVDDYKTAKDVSQSIDDEVSQSLSEFEKKLCCSLRRIEVRGKQGRKVPILLTKEVEKGLDVLVTVRKDVGVNPENHFIFAVDKNEMEMLATFLGHDLDIHKKYYRLPENALQLAKCGKLMLLMGKGGIGKYHGKNLDEIDLDLEGLYYTLFLSTALRRPKSYEYTNPFAT